MSLLIAHGHVDERINNVNQKIKKYPLDASLYLKRGKLYLEANHFKEAMDDFKRVKHKQTADRMIDYYIAKIHLKSNEYVLARKHTNISLKRVKSDKNLALLYEQLAKIEKKTKQFDVAIELYKKILLLDINLKPKHYHQLIQVYKLKGKKENINILKLIHSVEKNLGYMAIFEDEALVIELEEKNYEKALVRLEKMIQKKRRLIFLYKQKSEILEKLQRYDEAYFFYGMGLRALEKLPSTRQKIPIYQKIKLEFKNALLKLKIKVQY
jgi:tetratricopeptide (TPR) repeat protein